MILHESSQNVLALAYYGVQMCPPTDPITPTPRGFHAKWRGRNRAMACCKAWGLIDDAHQITERGLEVLQLGGRL